MTSGAGSPSEIESLNLLTRDGQQLPTLVYRPVGAGPHPAVVLGVEAYGVNEAPQVLCRPYTGCGSRLRAA